MPLLPRREDPHDRRGHRRGPAAGDRTRPGGVETPALAAALDRLHCPHCHAALALAGASLTCANGHSYDIARQGYVSLTRPRRRPHRGDSPEMVAARDEFLRAGHFEPIADAAAAAALEAMGERAGTPGFALDLGAGTGYQLARLLDSLPGWRGLALDASTPALRRAARAHPRLAAVACDVWGELPLRDGAADLALNVFAPRGGGEIARVLAPDGALIVVTPTARHLQELAVLPGMLRVDERKEERLQAALSPALTAVARRELELRLELSRVDVRRLVAMGPSAHHVDPDELERRLAELPEPATVTASVTIETFRPRR